MESKPVSGPSWVSRRVLLLRSAPRCSCLVQPLRGVEPAEEQHHEASELRVFRGRGGPALAGAAKISAAVLSVQKSA